tara:strand:+ start:1759 stop:2931 length:1173 start_codon:yes stop_codon:yes gene_type:complete
MKHIFLDNNSTTKISKDVLDEMNKYLTNYDGNPSSNNFLGIKSKEQIKISRSKIAKLVNCDSKDIYFTSGATESNNLAIKGVCELYRNQGNHIITFKTEHKAVLDTYKSLESKGFKTTILDVNQNGTINISDLEESITSKTILCSLMHANNEIGNIYPIKKVSEICKNKNIKFFVDGAQAVGKIHVDLIDLDIDFYSFTGHKFYGPKGIGCLYIKNSRLKKQLTPQIIGGGQEFNYRSGTLNTASIIGFGKASEISHEKLKDEIKHIEFLRDKMITEFDKHLSGIHINGDMESRIPGNLNISFLGVDNLWLLSQIHDKVSISAGSACSSQTIEPSHVLRAINKDDNISSSAIRICVGRNNSEREIDYFINLVLDLVNEYRNKTNYTTGSL